MSRIIRRAMKPPAPLALLVVILATFLACEDDVGGPVVARPDGGIAVDGGLRSGDGSVAGPLPDPILTAALGRNEAFIPVFRPGPAPAGTPVDAGALPSAQSPTFYLAIKKTALAERWFLSAYMRQYTAGTGNPAVSGAAAHDLGTQIVTYRIANDRLLVLDVSSGRRWSDAFDPEALLEAYPLVSDFQGWNRLSGTEAYVLIDPARGLNRFSLEGSGAMFTSAGQVGIDLAFVQNFRRLDDGVAFEQIFSGYQQRNLAVQGRVSGTLAISLRRYAETPGFMPKEVPAAGQHPAFFFTSLPPQLVPNAARTRTFITKWALDRAKPITWTVSASVDASTRTYAKFDVDVYAAVKRGIESWNDLLGFQIFVVQKASADDTLTDADRNILLWDPVPTAGAAFADFRTNPATGEIRNASVYMPASFIERGAEIILGPGATGLVTANLPPQDPAMTLSWPGRTAPPLCDLSIQAPTHAEIPTGTAAASIAALSIKEKLERQLSATVAHEIGHTLGLRHNFKGSLVPPSTSIMEYNDLVHTVAGPLPGPYDKSAFLHLYEGSAAPTQPFCTDSDLANDALCAKNDATANPLRDHHAVRWQQGLAKWMIETVDFDAATFLSIATDGLRGLDRFVRLSSTETMQLDAWKLLATPLRTPLVKGEVTASRTLQTRRELATQTAVRMLYPDPLPSGSFATPIVLTTDLAIAMSDLFGDIVNDGDGFRTIETRRQTVEALRRMQHIEGLRTLRASKDYLMKARATAKPDDGLLLEDLMARIDRAVSPYFDR